MSFANPFSLKTPGVTTIGAGEVNAAGVSISKAIDGTGGGAYAPVSKVQIGGAGLELTNNTWPMLNTRTVTKLEAPTLGLRRGWAAQKSDWDTDPGVFLPPWSGESHRSGVQSFYFHTLPGIATNGLYLDSSVLQLSPINGATMTNVEFNTVLENDGGGTIQAMPQCMLFRMPINIGLNMVEAASAVTSMTLTDGVWTKNEVVPSIGFEVIDTSVYSYFLQVFHPRTTVSGHAFRSVLLMSSIRSTYSVSKMQL